MGVIAEILRVTDSVVKVFKTAPGKAPVVKGPAIGGVNLELEMYGTPGVVGLPGKGTRVIHVPITEKYRIGIAGHNYALTIDLDEGETTVYSTSADGETLKATIHLDDDGNISLNGDTERLAMYGPLNTALQNLVTAINTTFGTKLDGGGTAGALTLNLAAAEATRTHHTAALPRSERRTGTCRPLSRSR